MPCSDTMGNMGAFITIKGDDLKPKFTTYEAVVSTLKAFCSFDFQLLDPLENLLAASSKCKTNGVCKFFAEFADVVKITIACK